MTAESVITSNVTEQTLDKFKKGLLSRCREEGKNTVQLTYDELAELTNLSKGAVYKSINALSERGFLKKTSHDTRRIANIYTVLGPIVENKDTIHEHVYGSGEEYISGAKHTEVLMQQLTQVSSELAALKRIYGDAQIVSKMELPNGFVSIIYKP